MCVLVVYGCLRKCKEEILVCVLVVCACTFKYVEVKGVSLCFLRQAISLNLELTHDSS